MSDEVEKPKCDLKDITIVILSFLMVGSAIGLTVATCFGWVKPPDAATAGAVGTFTGFLISEAKNVTSYWFGTTKSSADQQKTIATMAATAGGTGTGAGTTTVTGNNPTIVTTPPPTEPIQVVNPPGEALKTETGEAGIDNLDK